MSAAVATSPGRPAGPVILAPVGDAVTALVSRDAATLEALRRLHIEGRIDALLLGAGSLTGDVPRTDPAALAAVLSRAVPGLGVIATALRTNDHPYNLARRTLTLDHLTGARSGVLFAAGDPHEAERVRVVRELWNSYPVSSIVGDRETGVFAVLDGVRDINHNGAHYRVAGALNTPSSRQGEPVSLLFSADGSGAGSVDIVVVRDDSVIPAAAADTHGSHYYLLTDAAGAAAAAAATGAASRAAGIIVTVPGLAAAAELPAAPTTGGTLRETLGLAPRTLDLSDRPHTFEGSR